MSAQVLSPKQLALVFGVSEVTVYNWSKDTPTKSALPVKRTPAALTKWAERNGVPMVFKPDSEVVKKAAGTPITRRILQRANAAAKIIRRNGAGNLTSIRPAARASAHGERSKPR